MDAHLKKALEFADYKNSISVQRKLLKEKFEAKLTFGFNSGIFYINANLLSLVTVFIENNRYENVPIIDINGNPIMVENLNVFKEEIFNRYFSAAYEYFVEYEKLKKSRSIEKLIDL